jgi:hypothetical protein
MSRPKGHPTDATVGQRNSRGVYEQRKRGPSKWVYVGSWPTDDYTTADSPEWENGWDHAGDPFDRVAFRWDEHGRLETKGHADSSGAASGTVAFTLPDEYWPAKDVSWLTDVVAGASPSTAQVYIAADTGEVTITLL